MNEGHCCDFPRAYMERLRSRLLRTWAEVPCSVSYSVDVFKRPKYRRQPFESDLCAQETTETHARPLGGGVMSADTSLLAQQLTATFLRTLVSRDGSIFKS